MFGIAPDGISRDIGEKGGNLAAQADGIVCAKLPLQKVATPDNQVGPLDTTEQTQQRILALAPPGKVRVSQKEYPQTIPRGGQTRQGDVGVRHLQAVGFDRKRVGEQSPTRDARAQKEAQKQSGKVGRSMPGHARGGAEVGPWATAKRRVDGETLRCAQRMRHRSASICRPWRRYAPLVANAAAPS